MKQKLKNKWGVTLFLVGTLLLGACSEESSVTEDPSQPLMQVVTNGIETRAGVETQFATGDAIGIYVVNRVTENVPASLAGLTGNWLDNIKVTLGADGNWDGNSLLTWKDKNTVVDAYAYYPWKTTPGNADITAWPVEVSADQSQASAIRGSDFLWAKTNGVSFATDEGRLTLRFKHCFAKLNIRITGNGITNGAQIVSMEISGLKTAATFNMNTGEINGVTGEAQLIIPYYTSGVKNTAEVILIPQSVEAGELLSVTIQDQQNKRLFKYNLKEAAVFKAGEEYNLQMEYTTENGLKSTFLSKGSEVK
ncbi:fimbrillin family protein [uncultured Odoribacter sp.]|uniref:fimbrillin family protein n=1 Tax=uncultured Odoribacter sp. TaxID=876416 RepID=UPI002607EAE3|nr:fimbrillin family protein [uncultured Odoribacter sp.]